jgi:hypothetical protein
MMSRNNSTAGVKNRYRDSNERYSRHYHIYFSSSLSECLSHGTMKRHRNRENELYMSRNIASTEDRDRDEEIH